MRISSRPPVAIAISLIALGCRGLDSQRRDGIEAGPHYGRPRPLFGDFVMQVDSIQTPAILIMKDIVVFRTFLSRSNSPCSSAQTVDLRPSPYVVYITVFGTAHPTIKCSVPRVVFFDPRWLQGEPNKYAFVDMPYRVVACQPDGTPLRRLVKIRWMEDGTSYLQQLPMVADSLEREERTGRLLAADQEICASYAKTWIH